MADTIREQIIKAAGVQLAKITTTNGYQYTMGTPQRAVKNFSSSAVPLSIYFPGTEENARIMGKDVLTFSLRIESHHVIGSTNPSVIQEKMLGDLRKAMSSPAKWTTLIEDVEYSEGGPADQPEAEDTTTAVYAVFTIKYKTNIGNPYSNS